MIGQVELGEGGPFASLPDELLLKVFGFALCPKTVHLPLLRDIKTWTKNYSMLTMVCKRWKQLCGDKSLHQPFTRADLVYVAKLAEQAERYSEMAEALKQLIIAFPLELTVEERNLLSVAFKNEIGSRRASWRIFSAIEQKESAKDSSSSLLPLIKARVEQVGQEISGLVADVLELVDMYILPHTTVPEARVFFLKMITYATKQKSVVEKNEPVSPLQPKICMRWLHKLRKSHFGPQIRYD